ncbi:MAG: immune inhibitor A domain-containing protein [Permianibacter sp.]
MNLNKLSLLALAVAGALTLTAVDAVAAPAATQGTPKDPGVINKERILYWARKRGELPADASEEAKHAYLTKYLKHAKAVNHLSAPMAKALEKARSSKQAKALRHSKAFEEKTVKVLTVLIDFPDLPHDNNRLTRQDTDMYYADYNVAHYRDLMFSTTGYAGPSGQNLMSGYQYYQAESGGSLHFTGDVYDWVRADNDAAHYGGNEGEEENDRAARELIREAVAKTVAANASNPDFDLADYDVEDQYDIDGDGNLNEPDGMIDHVMVFHSSVGEEAGGGVLGDDAIWSHRWTVGQPYTIPGTSYKLYGYTIQPIDAAAGVVVHEFGHDLGLPDEYDTDNSAMGEPIGMWSVMSGGSWAGAIAGTAPVGFSPYARDLFQQWYGGNWVNQTVLDLSTLQTETRQLDLVAAVNHDAGTINQVRIDLPGPVVAFQQPYAGSFQFWSGQGDMLDNRMSFNVTVPNADDAQLQFQAKWNIEDDYDYVRVLVNGTAIAGNNTIASVNPHHAGVTHYLTGNRSASWALQTFSLAAYKGQTVTIEFEYVTDQAVGDYGMVIDALTVTGGGNTAFSADAESDGQVTLNGFSRVGAQREGLPQQYYVQLRNHSGVDAGLAAESYDDGVVLWFADPNYNDNNVETHPGHGFLGVVDADQVLMRSGSRKLESSLQVRDAAFRRMTQTAKANDNHLAAIFSFDDRYDYSSPESPQSGLVLPEHKLVMSVVEQAGNSSTARIYLSANPAVAELTASISKSVQNLAVNFTSSASGGSGSLSYLWNFGDNSTSTEASPSHTYSAAGTYTVTLTVTDSNGVAKTVSDSVTVTSGSTGGGSGGGGGGGGGSFAWSVMLLLGATRLLRRK